jgi:hypothetical protein
MEKIQVQMEEIENLGVEINALLLANSELKLTNRNLSKEVRSYRTNQ